MAQNCHDDARESTHDCDHPEYESRLVVNLHAYTVPAGEESDFPVLSVLVGHILVS